jgi:hypothetical protein
VNKDNKTAVMPVINTWLEYPPLFLLETLAFRQLNSLYKKLLEKLAELSVAVLLRIKRVIAEDLDTSILILLIMPQLRCHSQELLSMEDKLESICLNLNKPEGIEDSEEAEEVEEDSEADVVADAVDSVEAEEASIMKIKQENLELFPDLRVKGKSFD